jgi:hypothetical protein
MANSVWSGGQEFLIIAIPGDRQDAATTSDIVAQQPIEIVPGMKIKDKKTGQEFKVLSKPTGFYRQVEIQDIHHVQLSLHVLEDELRQRYHFISV